MGKGTSFANVFCIPHEGRHIIYLPLRGIIMLGNAKLVNLLYQARLGDEAAMRELGADEAFVLELFESGKQLRSLAGPKKIPAFAPTSVSLFLTSNCTLRCRYCYAEGGKSTAQMPWDMISGVLDEVLENVLSAKLSHMTVHFHGGGDVSAAWLLFVRAREYLGEITEPRGIAIRTSVGTNGMLNREQQKWVIRNIENATISIDGPPDIQDFQRPRPDGGPSFPMVSDTIRAFDEAGYPYGIRSTVTAESVFHLDEIVSYFCKHFGTRRIKVEPMYPRGRGVDSQVRPPDAVAFVENFRKARAIARDAGRDLEYSGVRLGTLTNVFCQAAGESCGVTPDGWITGCYEVLNPTDPLAGRFFYGHYDRRLKRLVVDDEKRKRLFDLSVENKPFCAKCFCKWHCAGDCPAKSSQSGEMFSSDAPDRCYINRELTKDRLVEVLDG